MDIARRCQDLMNNTLSTSLSRSLTSFPHSIFFLLLCMPDPYKTTFAITIIPINFQVTEVSEQLKLQSLPHIIPPITIHAQPFLARTLLAIFVAKKKYKPVAKKVRPVATELPERFCIQHNILGDLLEGLTLLSTNPPPFILSRHYMLE